MIALALRQLGYPTCDVRQRETSGEAPSSNLQTHAEAGHLPRQLLHPTEVGQKLARHVQVLLGALNVILYRLEQESEALGVLAWSGNVWPSFAPHMVVPLDAGLAGLVIRERRPLVTPNLLADPRVKLTPEMRVHFECAVHRAVLAVPLLVGNTVVGALEVGDRPGRVFGDKEIRLAQTLCDQAALALESSRLYEEAQRALTELKVIQEESGQGATL